MAPDAVRCRVTQHYCKPRQTSEQGFEHNIPSNFKNACTNIADGVRHAMWIWILEHNNKDDSILGVDQTAISVQGLSFWTKKGGFLCRF